MRLTIILLFHSCSVFSPQNLSVWNSTLALVLHLPQLRVSAKYLKSKTSVRMPVLICLSEVVGYIKTRKDGQHLANTITMESRCFANSYSCPCFLRAVFILTAHTVFSHLSKPIQALRNISHLYGLVKSLAPRGITNIQTQTHTHTRNLLRSNPLKPSPLSLPWWAILLSERR